MSHVLAEALGLSQPKFNQAIMALERRSGHPNYDLHLSSQLTQGVRSKISELGLDPEDTDPAELYFALNHKLADSDRRLVKKLRSLAAQKVNAQANLSDGLKILVKELRLNQTCLSIKSSVIKKQLQKYPPKKTMKALNYRSLDSLLKLEPVALVLLAMNYYESESYLKTFYSQYRHYSATSLESRPLTVHYPHSKRWPAVLGEIKSQTGLNLVSSYELASIVILPIDNEPEPGQLSLLLSQLVSEAAVILAVSSYLKLHQVDSDLGSKIESLVEHEPYVEKKLLGRPITWQTAQEVISAKPTELNVPHLSLGDLLPENLMDRLSETLEELKFWSDSQALALVHSAQTTSFNILDVAHNLTDHLSFENRQAKHFKTALFHELIKLYLTPDQFLENHDSDQPIEEVSSLENLKAQAVY